MTKATRYSLAELRTKLELLEQARAFGPWRWWMWLAPWKWCCWHARAIQAEMRKPRSS